MSCLIKQCKYFCAVSGNTAEVFCQKLSNEIFFSYLLPHFSQYTYSCFIT